MMPVIRQGAGPRLGAYCYPQNALGKGLTGRLSVTLADLRCSGDQMIAVAALAHVVTLVARGPDAADAGLKIRLREQMKRFHSIASRAGYRT